MKLAAAAFVLAIASAPSPRVSGVWTFDFSRDITQRWLLDAPASSDCTLKQNGRTLTGTCGIDAVPLMGVVNGRRVTFRIKSDAAATITAELDADGANMKGTWRLPDRAEGRPQRSEAE
jgi:hypothetical protein